MSEGGRIAATLGLGGNIGDPPHAMAEALRAIDAREDTSVVAVSKLYRTPPWGKTDQPDFFNACALIKTRLAADQLLELCLSTELDMKRVRVERWGPRTIDIDILTYGDLEISSKPLEIPHPRMTERGFVLLPLADIAADLTVSGKSVGDWLAGVDRTGIEVADADADWWQSA
ncbi:2-amino-4-hydroxy-6-hydroxymethyldihydropteridine diphosphokinase [Rhizobium sp. NRK18]|uniref:2-amino-4-hydroxy-6- hydroxymethyldihydropteridine diphosphokinase n=1 Tax=Rhizobium sp. NRK18 TaxID=2964667 RepID=UPI003965C4D6